MKFFKSSKNQIISQIVILSVIFGFWAGIVGQLFSKVYIDPLITNYSIGETNRNLSTIPELHRVKRFLGTELDFKINETIQKIKPTLVGIYLKKSGFLDKSLTQIYLEKNFLGNAFILTSDGWLITQKSIIDNNSLEQLVFVIDKKVFSAEELKADKLTNVVFVKIKANNLPVVDLGDFLESDAGQVVLAVNSLGEAVVTNIAKLDYQPKEASNDFIESSEKFSKSILLRDSLDSSFQGTPLVNLGGEVIGVVNSLDKNKKLTLAIPVNYFRFTIPQLLKTGKIKVPYLGINYLDLAKIIGISENISQGLNKGALVYSRPDKISPAAQGGIKVNDIITKINNEELSTFKNLTEIIQEYQIGDKIILTILREGQEISVEVYLGVVE